SFEPKEAPPGTMVVIKGTGFDPYRSYDVSFGGSYPTGSNGTPTVISLLVPVNALSGIISITGGDQNMSTSEQFTVIPLIEGMQPREGFPGDQVSIWGWGFSPSSTVSFNGVLATPSSQNY